MTSDQLFTALPSNSVSKMSQDAILKRVLTVWFWIVVVITLLMGIIVFTNNFVYQYVVILASTILFGICLYWAISKVKTVENNSSINILVTLLFIIAIEMAIFFPNGCYAIISVSSINFLILLVINKGEKIFFPVIVGTLAFIVLIVLQNQGVLAATQVSTSARDLLIIPICIAASISVIGLLTLLLNDYLRQATRDAEERSTAAENARAEQAITLAKVEHQAAEQARLLDLVRDLETPIIPLLEGVLVLPLVGYLDTRRVQDLTHTLLERVASERAHTVLIDLTAITVIDTATANHLVQLTQAVRLLGAECILTGIRAEVAHTLVMLGVTWQGLQTAASLRDGIERLSLAAGRG